MDEIQRKLALIDQQLAGRSLCRRLASTAPLFFPALGLMAGIALQAGLPDPMTVRHPHLPAAIWLVFLVGATAGAGVYLARNRRNPHPVILACGASLCFVCLGAIRLLAFEKADPRDIRSLVGPDRILASVRGRILTVPYQEPQDWYFGPFASTDPSSAFYLKLDRARTSVGWRPVTGTIRVQVDEPTPNLKIGDGVQMYCWLHRFEEPANPGQFNLARHLQRRNIFVGASVPAREAIEVRNDGPRSGWINLRRTFMAAAAEGLLDHPPADTQGEAMLEALLLGQRHHIGRDVNEAFRRTGLLHLISLSGMHLGILIAIVWGCCKPAGFSKRMRALICIGATGVFLLVVPPLGPILRAAVIVWAYCASLLLRRRTNAVNSLSLAAIVLLLLRPTQLFEAGWQLSFASVGGILAFTRRVEDFVHRTTRDRLHPAERETRRAMRLLKGAGAGGVLMLSVGFSAWLASAGILLYHFYNITPLASLWTVLASPAVTAILAVGFLKIILSFLLPTVSMLLGHVLAVLANVLIGMVKIMATLDFSYILIGHVPLVLIVLYYTLILCAAFAYVRRPHRRRGLCVALALVLVVSLGTLKWQRTHRDCLRLTCLDVGHGQAILAQLPGTRNILFDAGSLYGRDVGTRIVGPFLDYIGISRLHAVVLSHHDLDHINGLPEIVDLRRVDGVYLDEASFPRSAETAGLLIRYLEARHIRIEPLARIPNAGPAQIHVLWPVEETNRLGLEENDKSLVCTIEFAGRSVLLCSDIERPAQQEIMGRYPALRADAAVVPHHGSVRTLQSGFLERLQAKVLVCSCGRRDYEQGRVTKRVNEVEPFATAARGAITVCIDKAGVVKTEATKNK
jgi:competence protein ComEC